MKTFNTLFLLLSFCFIGVAQLTDPKDINTFFTNGISKGNYFGINFQLSYQLPKKRVTFHLGVNFFIKEFDDAPSIAGITGSTEFITSIDVLSGYIFQLGKKELSPRLHFKMGIGYERNNIPENWSIERSSWFDSVRSHSRRKSNHIAFIIEPTLELPFFSRHLMLSFSPYFRLSDFRRNYGLKVGYSFGGNFF